jgi:serine/threonine protein kinase/Tol biopolymer transport system component
MALAIGFRLGSYEVVGPLGAGGMGEVYRAVDTRLDRQVAIKILPEAVRADPERTARFEREAKLLASQNHPNIAGIYGFERASDEQFIVMELVDGETLADRIALGPIPVPEALHIAKQIADALEAAHEAGVIHRDLKPANVKVRGDGTVKVLDFGLAKALDREPARGAPLPLTNSPTLTSPVMVTGVGVLLGTAAYMSPEQAKGKPVDARTDIWAFGCVLYEMLTGHRLFEGKDIADTLATILKIDPDWSRLPADLPPSLGRVLRRCLEKDPRKRLRAIGDARLELEERDEPAPVVRPRRLFRERVAWITAIASATALAVLAARYFAPSPPLSDTVRFDLDIPATRSGLGWPEVSPDGRHLAGVETGDDGVQRIWVRPMDTAAVTRLSGTEGASYPFWSPDGRSIAFFADDVLKRVAIAGTPPQVVAPAARGRGGSWHANGTMLFSSTVDGAERLQWVPDSGGTPTVVPVLDGPNMNRRWPHFLPDGRNLLFFFSKRDPATDGVYLSSLDGTTATRLVPGFVEARYQNGYLFYVRGDALVAQGFDADRGRLAAGEPVLVAPSVEERANEAGKAFSVSDTGTVVFVPAAGRAVRRLRWLGRKGELIAEVGESDAFGSPRIAPDGAHIVSVSDSTQGDAIWITDVATDRPMRFTFAPGEYSTPVWSRTGERILASHSPAGTGFLDLFAYPASGVGSSQPLIKGDRIQKRVQDVSPNGEYLLYAEFPTQAVGNLVLWSFADGKKAPYIATGRVLDNARISPDGHWVAYESTESGPARVYIQSFPVPGTKYEVSSSGGTRPIWNASGSELFFVSGGQLTAVAIAESGRTLQIGAPRALFPFSPDSTYDVDPKTGRFLVSVAANRPQPATVLLNWRAPAGPQ